MAARRVAKSGSRTAEPNLLEVALGRLDHGDRTKKQLKDLLLRKAGEPGVAKTKEIDELLARLESSGVVSDERFAEHYARSARQRGASSAKVRQKLAQKGVDRAGVDRALGVVAEEGQDELAAAQSYVKRRRLTERYDLGDSKQRLKALASLARQGFSSGVARAALGATGDEEDS